jgi:5-methylcytosine-specific restriction endonuclease McrA
MPIDKEAGNLLSPILDLSTKSYFTSEVCEEPLTHQQQRIMTSGGKPGTKRSVSETKKKFVASQQGWKCGNCDKQLTAWFEVDHKVRLEYGGSNEVSNLVALCRECHGEKTTMENL